MATQSTGKAPGKSPAPTRPVAPRAESGDTVTVACRLPQGIHMDIVRHGEVRQRVTLKGSNSPGPVAGFGITENVPREFFEKWLADHQDLAAVKNGLMMTRTVRRNADHAGEACDLANGALDVTSRGSAVVNDVVDRMHAIVQSSIKIAEIIGLIDGIALQTNILALNAAVEAARAGDQGCGLAVVACEMRALAQRSANAAKEIKTLIDDSVDPLRGGSERVEHAGDAMREVSETISRLAQMDQMTRQNAALVEDAAASLHQQTRQTKDAVAGFQISQAVPGSAARVVH